MRKVQVSNGTCDTPTTNRSVDTDNDSDEVLTHAATESQCVPKSYIHWCYHPSTDWILWYLVSKLPKEEDGRISDVGLTPARVDSGIGLHLLGHEDGHLSPTAASTPSTPITLSFHFKDGTTTKLLDYRVYSQWANVNSLLNELAQDGIVIDELWDVNEDMPIGSGDWDARIQPGSVIEAWYFNEKRSYCSGDLDGSSDCESDEETVESGGDGDDTESEYTMSWMSSAKETRNEHTWWFTRWRQRVEKTVPGRKEALDEPSWFMIVVWCTSIVGIVVIVSVLSL